ncbi:MAG: CDP-alcohol phosphatidyltransferase family protein [Acidimicrobiia bacterium]|nr:CDP-alcohol phosphatidyltransferase family protein [Acidimicrobiia bacterium]MDH3397506.1 CDP-alcohol phosphatidyltransferase family protein [Acidimicrobiia bacterium]MDH5615232.1 CDP-alcohol phosphatidyltransferase family protein [Acidimicrobiia bacterium]
MTTDAGLYTIPNVISLLRLAGIGAFWWLLFGRDDPVAAGVLILVIGWTDWLDGVLARKLNQVSEIGKLLDPLADRLAIAAALIGGMIAAVIPLWLGVALIVREAGIALGALVLGVRLKEKLEVRYLGKVATFILYGAIPSFYLKAGGVAGDLFLVLGWFFGMIGLVLYYWVAVQYAIDIRAKFRHR